MSMTALTERVKAASQAHARELTLATKILQNTAETLSRELQNGARNCIASLKATCEAEMQRIAAEHGKHQKRGQRMVLLLALIILLQFAGTCFLVLKTQLMRPPAPETPLAIKIVTTIKPKVETIQTGNGSTYYGVSFPNGQPTSNQTKTNEQE